MIGRYKTPQAFRNALETRLRRQAQRQGTDLQRLRRRVAFERLLARLFSQQDPPWLLKGGYALELRLQGQARSTLDLDMAVPDPEQLQLLAPPESGDPLIPTVYEYLQEAAERDLGDGFRFHLSRPKEERSGAPAGGLRCSVEALLAGRVFAQFHLDVGLGDAVQGQPEWIEGDPMLGFAGIPATRVALYPVAQQFAEKVHAYTFPWPDRENTRDKDLVDLVLLLHLNLLEPEAVRQALAATFTVRSTHPLPEQLPPPPDNWAGSYTAQARDLHLPAQSLEEAISYLETYWQRWDLASALPAQTPTSTSALPPGSGDRLGSADRVSPSASRPPATRRQEKPGRLSPWQRTSTMPRKISAVLFDLDGTLLDNDMDEFLPPYFHLLSSRMAHLVPPDKFLEDLMWATGIMIANDGQTTNEEAFAQAFFPRVGVPREVMEPLFLDFYQRDFPSLQVYTRRKPEARAVVELALERGCDVVVSTNPLFPAVAIEERIRWAGVDGLPYALITTYENSRACKPNLLYFEYILEAICRTPQESLVVGDEDMDMVAAHLGCRTFLVPGSRTALGTDTPPPTYQGSLAELEEVLRRLNGKD